MPRRFIDVDEISGGDCFFHIIQLYYFLATSSAIFNIATALSQSCLASAARNDSPQVV
jgi:hypothetical protein